MLISHTLCCHLCTFQKLMLFCYEMNFLKEFEAMS